MKRWYVFFVLVGILVALAGLGVFSGGSLEQQTAGGAGRGKAVFLAVLAFGGLSFASWLAYSSSARKRRLDAQRYAAERGTASTGTAAAPGTQDAAGSITQDAPASEAPWTPPAAQHEGDDRPRNDPTR